MAGKRGFARWVRLQYLRLLRLDGSAEKVALGLSLGVIIGVAPTFGLGVLIAVVVAGALRVNKAAALLGTLVMNPWTAPFFWALSFITGCYVLGYDLHGTVEVVKSLKTQGGLWESVLARRLLLPYIIGNIIITAAAAATSYVLGLYAVKAYRGARNRKRQHKHIVSG